MRILVVGASGVLGRRLVPQLVAAGHDVRPASRQLNGFDLLTSDLAPYVGRCDAVVHAATAIPRGPSAPGAWTLNTRLRTEGTRRLLGACLTLGVRRYIQQSITLAYVDGGDALLDESTPFDADPSRASIVEPVRDMEAQVRASTLHWTILRGGQFVGPGTAQDDLVARLRSGSPISLPCAGTHWLSPIHPADLASAVVAALARAPERATFNITDEPVRYAEYVDRLAVLTNAPQAERPAHDTKHCPASHRCTARAARDTLAWQPTHSFWPDPVDILPRHLTCDTPT